MISQPEDVLANMSSWCRSTFARNGLLQKIRESNISIKAAESQVLAYDINTLFALISGEV